MGWHDSVTGRFRVSLTTRLLLAFAALIIPLLLFSVWSFQRSLVERRAILQRDVVGSAETSASLVASLLGDLDSTSALMSLNFGQQPGPLDQTTIGLSLTAMSERYQVIRAVFVTDLSGRVVAAQRAEGIGVDLGNRPYTRALLGGQDFILTDVVQGLQSGEPTITMARTIRAPDGGLRGLMVIAFYPGQLAELFPRALPVDANLTVVDRGGQVIYSSARTNLSAAERDLGGEPPVQAALGGKAALTAGIGFEGRDRLGAVAPVRDYGWAVGYSRTTESVEGPLGRLFRRQLAGLGVITLAALVAALLLIRRLTRRLTQLAAHAHAFGRGEQPAPVPVSGPVEVQALATAFNEMAAEVQARFAEREIAEARYRGIFDHALEGIFQTGFNGSFQTVNPAAARLLGYESPEELITTVTNVRQLYADPKQLDEYLQMMQTRGEVANFEVEVRRKDGSTRWVLLNARAKHGAGGRIETVEGMVTDITDRKRVESERERWLRAEQDARSAAEAANRAKDEFLSVLSHELRTPLTPILGFTAMLRRKGVETVPPETLTRALETIDRSARTQARLVDDLLDLSRVMAGKLQLDLRPTELLPVIEAVVETVRPAAESKGVALLTELERDVGPVLGDADRLQQAVANLLTNAVKFTPEGGVVTVRLTRDGVNAIIAVTDTGIGIEPDFLEHVFERFRQADASSTRVHGGLGLGLSIVHDLVALHGGRVTAASAGHGRGATFTVCIPLAAGIPSGPGEPAAGDSDSGEAAPAAPALAGIRVLVVEDDADTRAVLEQLLAAEGAMVTVAASSVEGLAALENVRPDVLVVDIGMPEEDGHAFIGKVRARAAVAGGQTPAVALTAFATVAGRRRAMASGFNAHLAKPVDPPVLMAAIGRILHER